MWRMLSAVFAAGILTLGVAMPAEARWLRAESAKFIVYSMGDERALRDYVANLEDFDMILRDQNGVKLDGMPPRKFELYLVPNSDQLRRVKPDALDRLGGFYSASLGDVFAIAIYDRSQERVRGRAKEDSADDTIMHEYTHHFMLQYRPNAYPAWLVEGYAEYFMNARLTRTTFELGYVNDGRAYTLLEGEWLPLEDLLTRTTQGFTDDQSAAYYAQAWLLTHYMCADPNRLKQLKAYIALVAKGTPSIEAWKQATGDDLPALTAKLKAYKKGSIVSMRYTRAQPRPDVAVTITTLPPSADDLLLENQRIKFRGGDDSEPSLLANIRAKAAKHPSDPFAQRVLARAEMAMGDRAKGVVIAKELLASAPNDAELLQLLGISAIDAARDATSGEEALIAEGVGYLTRAYAADGSDYRTILYLVMAQQMSGDVPGEEEVKLLFSAYQKAPQVQSVRLQFAQVLMRTKRWNDAIYVLTPLANDPHGGSGAEAAQDMLRRIKANR